MKKFLIVFYSFILVSAYSQNIQILDSGCNVINGQAITMQGSFSSTIRAFFDVKNQSANASAIRVKRQVLNSVPHQNNWFCWHQCYAPAVKISPVSVTLEAGQDTSLFQVGYSSPVAGLSAIRYIFWNESNPADSAWITINFETAGSTGISTPASQISTVTNAYPNPGSSHTVFNYHFASTGVSKAMVYNIIGEKINEYPLSKEGSLRIDLDDYEPGIYFCSFVNAGKTVATKRFTVR